MVSFAFCDEFNTAREDSIFKNSKWGSLNCGAVHCFCFFSEWLSVSLFFLGSLLLFFLCDMCFCRCVFWILISFRLFFSVVWASPLRNLYRSEIAYFLSARQRVPSFPFIAPRSLSLNLPFPSPSTASVHSVTQGRLGKNLSILFVEVAFSFSFPSSASALLLLHPTCNSFHFVPFICRLGRFSCFSPSHLSEFSHQHRSMRRKNSIFICTWFSLCSFLLILSLHRLSLLMFCPLCRRRWELVLLAVWRVCSLTAVFLIFFASQFLLSFDCSLVSLPPVHAPPPAPRLHVSFAGAHAKLERISSLSLPSSLMSCLCPPCLSLINRLSRAG